VELDQQTYIFYISPPPTQSCGEFNKFFGPDLIMVIKGNPLVTNGMTGRLAEIMKQGGPLEPDPGLRLI
jgi:hypothetical protein